MVLPEDENRFEFMGDDPDYIEGWVPDDESLALLADAIHDDPELDALLGDDPRLPRRETMEDHPLWGYSYSFDDLYGRFGRPQPGELFLGAIPEVGEPGSVAVYNLHHADNPLHVLSWEGDELVSRPQGGFGHLLVVGDDPEEQRMRLRNIAISALEPENNAIQLVIITPNIAYWADFQGLPQTIGVFGNYERAAGDVLLSITGYMESLRGKRKPICVLLDNLVAATHFDFEGQQYLQWMLHHGTEHQVAVASSLCIKDTGEMFGSRNGIAWADLFSTRVFGYMENRHSLSRWGVPFAIDGIDPLGYQWGQGALQYKAAGRKQEIIWKNISVPTSE